MKNPSNATLASLSILKYSKIQNGRQMAENIAKINIIHVCEAKRSLLLLSLLSSPGYQNMSVQKRHHESFKKIKMASKMAGINKKTASQSCIYSMFCF